MPATIFTMLLILVVAVLVIALVVMGMEGTGRQQHPEIANAMQTTARHLNGEAEPPRGLVALIDELEDATPQRIRSRSAKSAPSAGEPTDVASEDRVVRPGAQRGA